MDIDIAPVCEADANALLHMARALYAEEGRELDATSEAALVQVAKGEKLAPAWIVRSAGRCVGYVIVTLGYSVEYGGRDGFIDDLYLAPDVRGLGLGRRLLDFTLAEAMRLGIGTLHLEVEADNARATQLYRSAGFEETGRRLMRRLLKGR